MSRSHGATSPKQVSGVASASLAPTAVVQSCSTATWGRHQAQTSTCYLTDWLQLYSSAGVCFPSDDEVKGAQSTPREKTCGLGLAQLITGCGGENGIDEAGDEGDLIVELSFADLFEAFFAPPSGPLSLFDGTMTLQMRADRFEGHATVAGDGFGGSPQLRVGRCRRSRAIWCW